VLDANWRWLEKDGANCFTGNTWTCTATPAGDACAGCAVEGADYASVYGITTEEDALTLRFVTETSAAARSRGHARSDEPISNIGSRVYLMQSEDKYEVFYLKNREFAFTVDASQLGCGLNGALYFVEMAADGGLKYGGNTAGAKFGTGYCDAQCPHDLKYINGAANTIDWTPSATDPNAGTGYYGSCCVEVDVWEANRFAQAYTPHTCSTVGQVMCGGASCGDNSATDPESRYNGMCDKDGCDFNPYRFGVGGFFGAGPAYALEATLPLTVVTQFRTADGTDAGALAEISRLYVQGGRVLGQPLVSAAGAEFSAVSDAFCAAARAAFNETHDGFEEHGGMAGLGRALERGLVLAASVWDDHYANMLWLDGTFPVGADPATDPGSGRGPCPADSGDPAVVQVEQASASVRFSGLKIGTIGSTYAAAAV
jgi:cellulose 1,4-beta-cellobiosidase